MVHPSLAPLLTPCVHASLPLLPALQMMLSAVDYDLEELLLSELEAFE